MKMVDGKRPAAAAAAAAGGRRRHEDSFVRSVHTQTMIRDAEVQTQPCALDITSTTGTTSELIGIAFAAHGQSIHTARRRPTPRHDTTRAP